MYKAFTYTYIIRALKWYQLKVGKNRFARKVKFFSVEEKKSEPKKAKAVSGGAKSAGGKAKAKPAVRKFAKVREIMYLIFLLFSNLFDFNQLFSIL